MNIEATEVNTDPAWYVEESAPGKWIVTNGELAIGTCWTTAEAAQAAANRHNAERPGRTESEAWDSLDPNSHEHSGDPEYQAARTRARAAGEKRRAAYGQALNRLRQARSMTQVNLAKQLGVTQAEVSRVEHQTDILLSTVASYIEAMGGELSLLVTFPGMEPIEMEVSQIADDGSLSDGPIPSN